MFRSHKTEAEKYSQGRDDENDQEDVKTKQGEL